MKRINRIQTWARELRKNMTDAERKLWTQLRNRRLRGLKFRRQQPLGKYIVDFICFEKRLIIELDGSQHLEQTDDDAQRTAWLNEQGFDVLRFWNHQVLAETDSVMQVIWEALADRDSPSPTRGNVGSPLP